MLSHVSPQCGDGIELMFDQGTLILQINRFFALHIRLLVTVSGLKISVGVKESTGTFTYPLCPMQGVIPEVLVFCAGGGDSVCAV